jgi:hypothetical protein
MSKVCHKRGLPAGKSVEAYSRLSLRSIVGVQQYTAASIEADWPEPTFGISAMGKSTDSCFEKL